jgi:uncharacterized protein (DUF433 family)
MMAKASKLERKIGAFTVFLWPRFSTLTGLAVPTLQLLQLRLIVKKRKMSDLLERITVNPKQCGGRPCIRGMRIRVSDVLDLFAAGLSAEEILEDLPDLEMDDVRASLVYAARN